MVPARVGTTYQLRSVLNTDPDGDGIPTTQEMSDSANLPGGANNDVDGDGYVNWLDNDADGDGLGDALEEGDGLISTSPKDTDGDGRPDYLDRDDDNDGTLSVDENGRAKCDTNNDNVVTLSEVLACSGDPDGNGNKNTIFEVSEIAFPDTDSNGVSDFLQVTTSSLDTDGDGLTDGEENERGLNPNLASDVKVRGSARWGLFGLG
ncbi:MAG: hypothetical protein R3A11_04930 [Bdellovibrionota bacterium]